MLKQGENIRSNEIDVESYSIQKPMQTNYKSEHTVGKRVALINF